jgi:phosphoadenosine phosphosulfate reductase
MESKVNQIDFNKLSVEERLSWAYDYFGKDLVVSSSFQSQSVPLLHLISKTIPEVEIIFLDTGFHFPETISFKEDLTSRLGLNVIDVTNKMGHGTFKKQYGNLYKSDPDQCCYINKVEPLERVLSNYNAWITGIRSDQTEVRKRADFIQELDNGITKISPILDWTNHDVWTYVQIHELPQHPLLEQGYLSVGCAPCTQPSQNGDARSGRWNDSSKNECGLHNSLGQGQKDDNS